MKAKETFKKGLTRYVPIRKTGSTPSKSIYKPLEIGQKDLVQQLFIFSKIFNFMMRVKSVCIRKELRKHFFTQLYNELLIYKLSSQWLDPIVLKSIGHSQSTIRVWIFTDIWRICSKTNCNNQNHLHFGTPCKYGYWLHCIILWQNGPDKKAIKMRCNTPCFVILFKFRNG